jgi:predicted hotdog family 3-hydroxylacyl-ACP dehydratase
VNHWPLSELLPHAGEMLLVDELVSCTIDDVHVRVRIRPDTLFSNADGSLPAWVGIELMAQCVASYAGYHSRVNDRPVEMGFLLGTRRFECNVESFPAGSELDIFGHRSLQDDTGMGMFECRISAPGIQAEARLNVFRPLDASRYLQETRND